MKHSAGRRALRDAIRRDRKGEGRKRAKWNNWMNAHPNDSRLKKKEAKQ